MVLAVLRTALRQLGEGLCHGGAHASQPSCGALAVGAGGGRTRKVAPLLAPVCPPHPAPVLAGGRGVEARLLAMLDGPPALSKGAARAGGRGLVSLLQPGLTRASLHAERLGPRRAALCAAHRTRVCGASAMAIPGTAQSPRGPSRRRWRWAWTGCVAAWPTGKLPVDGGGGGGGG